MKKEPNFEIWASTNLVGGGWSLCPLAVGETGGWLYADAPFPPTNAPNRCFKVIEW
jgi:hypothetical protein